VNSFGPATTWVVHHCLTMHACARGRSAGQAELDRAAWLACTKHLPLNRVLTQPEGRSAARPRTISSGRGLPDGTGVFIGQRARRPVPKTMALFWWLTDHRCRHPRFRQHPHNAFVPERILAVRPDRCFSDRPLPPSSPLPEAARFFFWSRGVFPWGGR